MFCSLTSHRSILFAIASTLAVALGANSASAEALLLIEASTGKVLHAENATYPWYPASVTKMMTLYVTLRAIKDGKLTLDKVITVTDNAVAQQPAKMGFRAGTTLTVDNTIKMMMVKSANDMAVVLAEGVSGSIENFANDMNAAARKLGMTQTNYVNPNGLPAEGQVTSARDLAILARALIREFPEYDNYWHIPAIKLGKRVMRNTNRLIAGYPGADGMKTGFICASGFNLVGVATRNGRRLIAVVLGAHSGAERAEHAAALLESGFNTSPLSWLMPSLGSVDSLTPVNAQPLDLRDEMCGKNRKRHGPEADDDVAGGGGGPDSSSAFAAVATGFHLNGATTGSLLTGNPAASAAPIAVFIGPGKNGGATDVATVPSRKRGGKAAAVRTAPTAADKNAAEPAATAPASGTLGATIVPADGFGQPAGGDPAASTNPGGTAATPSAKPPKVAASPKKPKRKVVAVKPKSVKPKTATQ
jgi:D-alanyl-D-alanine carboxypeptidase